MNSFYFFIDIHFQECKSALLYNDWWMTGDEWERVVLILNTYINPLRIHTHLILSGIQNDYHSVTILHVHDFLACKLVLLMNTAKILCLYVKRHLII